MPSPKTNYLPYHQRNNRRRLLIGLFMLLSFFSGGFAGIYAWEHLERSAASERDELAHKLREAETVIEQLKLQNAVYENSSRVDQLAVRNTREHLKVLQEKLLEMGKEVEFYRRIVSPNHRDYELRIQDFRIFEGHQFALTLSQGIGRDATIQASARVQFKGQLHGKEKILNLHEVDRERRKELDFSFRYFQTVTADIHFPEGFELEGVRVTAKPHIKKSKTVSRSWSAEQLEIQENISLTQMGDPGNLN